MATTDTASTGNSKPRLESEKNYITPLGFAKLKEELRRLLYEERPKVVQTVSWAASNGDRSENGDYIYGKRRLREIDRRVHFLNRRLDHAVVIDPAQQKGDRILFGATVNVETEDGEVKTVTLVGADETDAQKGWISWKSPLARALLGHRVGDTVSVVLPQRESELTVLEFKYETLK